MEISKDLLQIVHHLRLIFLHVLTLIMHLVVNRFDSVGKFRKLGRIVEFGYMILKIISIKGLVQGLEQILTSWNMKGQGSVQIFIKIVEDLVI